MDAELHASGFQNQPDGEALPQSGGLGPIGTKESEPNTNCIGYGSFLMGLSRENRFVPGGYFQDWMDKLEITNEEGREAILVLGGSSEKPVVVHWATIDESDSGKVDHVRQTGGSPISESIDDALAIYRDHPEHFKVVSVRRK